MHIAKTSRMTSLHTTRMVYVWHDTSLYGVGEYGIYDIFITLGSNKQRDFVIRTNGRSERDIT